MASAQDTSTLRPPARQGSGCGRHTEKQTAKRTCRAARYGFLRQRFVPVISQRLAALGKPEKVERDFFSSLSHLTQLYCLAMPDLNDYDYPLNIAAAFSWAEKQLKAIDRTLQLIVVKDGKTTGSIATVKVFDTGSCLYYIPVKPLYQLLKHRRTKPQARLLLSVFSYLYHVAGVSYFTEGYLEGTYDMIHYWYMDDEAAFDKEDFDAAEEAFKEIEVLGRQMFKSIRHPYHLEQLAHRVNTFKPVTACDKALLSVSEKLLSLYRQYPSRSIFDSVTEGLLSEKDEEHIRMHEYISFFWSGNDALYEQLVETVNLHFQETAHMEEPFTVQIFNTPQAEETHDHDFEQRLFDCIAELNDYLNEK